jgi:hypothetical protein
MSVEEKEEETKLTNEEQIGVEEKEEETTSTNEEQKSVEEKEEETKSTNEEPMSVEEKEEETTSTNEEQMSVEEKEEKEEETTSTNEEPMSVEEKKEETTLTNEEPMSVEEKKKKKQKGLLVLGGGALLLGFFATMGEEEEDSNNKVNTFKKKDDQITFKETIKVDEIAKSEDFLKVLKSLESKVKNLENITNKTNSVTIEQLKAKEYEYFKSIESYLFKNKISVGKTEYFEKQGMEIIHYITDTDKRVLQNQIVLPINDGMLIKIPEINITFLIIKRNQDNKINYFNNNFDIWKIDKEIGLKKIISTDEKKQTLKFLSTEKNNPNFIYEHFKRKVIFIGKNLEIIERIDIVNEISKNSLKEPTDINETFELQGYLDNMYNKYIIEKGKEYINDELVSTKDNHFKIKLINYNNKKLEKHWSFFKYIDNHLVEKIKTEEIRKIYFRSYIGISEEGKEVEYLSKGKEIFEIDGKQNLNKLGEGYIVGTIKKGVLKVELELYNEVYDELNLYQFLNKTLVLEDGEEYKISEEGILNRRKLYPLTEVVIGSNSKLYISKEKIGSIKLIKEQGKTGIRVKTIDYDIKIRTKEDFEIRDAINKNLKFSNLNTGDNKIKFILKEKENKILAYLKRRVEINFEKKEINGNPYSTYEENENEEYLLYNEEGEVYKKIKKENKEILFEQKIIDFELIKGELFEYYFELNNKTGHIKSDKIGKLIKKYSKDTIPFSGFIDQIGSRRIVGVTKNLDLSKSELIDLKNQMKPNIDKFIFETSTKNTFQIMDDKSFIFGGNKRLILEKSFYNRNYSTFTILIDKNRNKNREITKLNLNPKLDKEQLKVIKTTYKDKDLLNVKTNEVIINFANAYYYKNKDEDFKLIVNKDFFFIENKISILLENGENIEIKLEDTKKLFPYLLKKYKTQLKIQLTPKIKKKYQSDFEKRKKEILKEQERKFTQSLEEATKELNNLMKKKIEPVVLELTEEQRIQLEEETEEDKKKYDYMFEIGQIMRLEIPESIEISEGETPFVMGKIKHLELTDLSNNNLLIENAKVLLEVKGDFTKGKVFVYPTSIIYFHPELGEKVTIEIPSSATEFIYTEKDKKTGEEYKTKGIPGYVVRAKLKTLPTRVVLKTVSGAIENLTKPDDMMGGIEGIAAATGGGEAGDTGGEEGMGESAASGVSEGIKELVDTITEIAEKEKDLIVTEPEIVGEVMFLEEVEVNFKDSKKKKKKPQKTKNKTNEKEKFKFTRKSSKGRRK